jgi:hypothetical protein
LGGTARVSLFVPKLRQLFSLRFACDVFIVSADISDWKTSDYEMIREYMKPIPR